MARLQGGMSPPEYEVIEALKGERINLVATLPCEKIRALLQLIPKNFDHNPLTTEENGVGICAGAYMAGAKPMMIIQSSGLGTILNALLSLCITYALPLPIIASWRGMRDEKIPAQIPLGRRIARILKSASIPLSAVNDISEIENVRNGVHDAFARERPHVILIAPNVWKESRIETEYTGLKERVVGVEYRKKFEKPIMTRLQAIETIAKTLDNQPVVCNLGFPSKELYTVKDRELNFYMLGSFGLVSSIGLGVARYTTRHTISIDGDGSLLANPSILAEVAVRNPRNLTIVAVDNGAHGSTGNQPTATRDVVDLELVARGFGINNTAHVKSPGELREALEDGVSFVHVLAKPYNAPVKGIPLKPPEIKRRFMKALSKA